MIPAFGLGEVLPPFVGTDVTGGQLLPRSPYPATVRGLVDRFCTSLERAVILRGLFQFRAALRAEGFEQGFQWIDGSFVENCEAFRGRPPGDVDIVSLLRRPPPVAQDAAWVDFATARIGTIFNPDWTKQTFHCDSYFIDLDIDPISVAEQAAYWIGLFSHQRDTFRWKGMVRIEFSDGDDAEALALIGEREAAW
ncbi:DUF6932 family protein [Novosphingobium panipatense]|uniref:Nucleotidyltransferase AbiEii toxin of type IV toxin-antitoxin system n=1 Tax=Novosphingobium panipatense TaxID=428991 RepID=A0ABY1PYC5_9SPHN|nr:hypothetical protein SAMN06296065_101360 [Novosphingobium panipatense]